MRLGEIKKLVQDSNAGNSIVYDIEGLYDGRRYKVRQYSKLIASLDALTTDKPSTEE